MMKTILLKLSGPLQSYGTSSYFQTRYTDYYPSKSAVLGLLAACLGYRRDEEEKLRELSTLKFAVRIDQQGGLLKDYHIAITDKEIVEIPQTYVTNRYYLEDALFVVALSGMNELIDTLIEAIKSPYFQPFMGRRSLPVPVDFFLGECAEDILDSLRNLPWQAAHWYKKKKRKQGIGEKISLEVYADEEILKDEKISRSKLRRDIPISFSQKGRQFAFRQEACISIEVLSGIEKGLGAEDIEHDVFSTLEGA
ncbi:type I-E CRISPR-associated protein Cas5/CasD [Oribacterium asaccharolyticum]|uniref:type I-E CRISPR-associated protein Cas5/CasD n=1 Tax=Oribacterium asaccharolyticum TaxID=1501332 RepID=UPI0028E31982|nr:type I-E CRISPR-associated protein Cas5/CasD [Oribacterium asaccharolyticum]